MKYVYRVVNAILGALVFVAAFFVSIIKIEISLSDGAWSTIKSVISAFSSSANISENGYALVEEFSINRVISILTGKDELAGLFGSSAKPFLWPEIFKPINVKLGFFAGFFALMLLSGLFIIVWSCISSKRIPMLIAGAAGILSDIGFIVTFKMWATPLADGTIDVSSWLSEQLFGNSELLSGSIGTIISTLAGSAIDKAFNLDLALCGIQNAMLFIFIGVLIWTAIFYLVEMGDPKVKEEKQAAGAYKEAAKEAKAADKALRALKNDSSADEGEIRKAEIAAEKAGKAAKAAYAKTEDGKAAEIRAAKKKARAEKKAAKAAEAAENTAEENTAEENTESTDSEE